MTLDPKKIEQWHQQARDNLFARRTIISHRDVLAEFARLARADAFEMAAKEARARAESCGGKAHPVSVGEAVSASIRALAEREKETK